MQSCFFFFFFSDSSKYQISDLPAYIMNNVYFLKRIKLKILITSKENGYVVAATKGSILHLYPTLYFSSSGRQNSFSGIFDSSLISFPVVCSRARVLFTLFVFTCVLFIYYNSFIIRFQFFLVLNMN